MTFEQRPRNELPYPEGHIWQRAEVVTRTDSVDGYTMQERVERLAGWVCVACGAYTEEQHNGPCARFMSVRRPDEPFVMEYVGGPGYWDGLSPHVWRLAVAGQPDSGWVCARCYQVTDEQNNSWCPGQAQVATGGVSSWGRNLTYEGPSTHHFVTAEGEWIDTPTRYRYVVRMEEHGPVLCRIAPSDEIHPMLTGSRPAPDGSSDNPAWAQVFHDIVSGLRALKLCAPNGISHRSNPNRTEEPS